MPPSECESSVQSKTPDTNQDTGGAGRADNRPKFTIRSGRSILAEIKSHALAYSVTKKSSYLTSFKVLMKDLVNLDSETGQNILKQDVHLVNFVNSSDEPATEEMAEMALEDIQSMWPLAVEHLTPAILLQIHNCIRVSKVTVKYQHLRVFLLDCARRIKQLNQPMTDTEAGQIAHDAEEMILMAMTDDASTSEVPQTKGGMLKDLVNARTDRLEEINRLSDLKLKSLLDMQEARITGEAATNSAEPEGEQDNTFDMQYIEAVLASVPDTNTPTVDESARQEAKSKNQKLAGLLDELADQHEQEIRLHELTLKALKDERSRIFEASMADVAVKFPGVDKEWAKNLNTHIQHNAMSAYEENINEKLKVLGEEAAFNRELSKNIRELI